MNFSTLRKYLAAKPGAVEDFPFDPVILVFKVGGKMFALVATDEDPPRINLKCDPLKAEILREYYPAVLPGYHMNKRHWNTVVLDGSIPDEELVAMIDESHDLVVQNLPRARPNETKTARFEQATTTCVGHVAVAHAGAFHRPAPRRGPPGFSVSPD